MASNNTLRHRLLRFILIPLLISLTIAGLVSFYAAKKETAEIYDKQLTLLAQVMHSLAVQEDGDEGGHEISRYDTILADSGENGFSYRIWLDEKLSLTSPNARKFKSPAGNAGFSNHIFNNEQWRVYVLQDEKNEITVEVAGRQSLRTDIIQEILLFMFVPLLLVIPIITGLVWYGVIKALRPISVLSQIIKNREPENLAPISSTEIKDEDVPEEIKPLVDGLNSLMTRMAQVLQDEKQFTDHAAHELRTPLAAIKTQAQVAMRATDKEAQQQMLGDLVTGVDRASHLVSQLLSLARAQSPQSGLTRICLSDIVERVENEFEAELKKRDLQLNSTVSTDFFVEGEEELLTVMVRNLLDNAIKYSPRSSVITLNLEQQKSTNGADKSNIVFSIANAGPTIPDAEQKAIFNHFYRLPGSNEMGCGLGLALVKKISEIHHAKINIISPDHKGLTCFSVTFPIF